MKKLVLSLIVFIALNGCQSSEGTPIWRVWYAVQLPPDYDVDILYHSDKYFDTGILDTVHVYDSTYVQQLNGFWVGQHLQSDKSDNYYIKAIFNELTPYEGRLGVFVYVNDTNLIDSLYFPFGTESIELTGEIPKVF